MSNIIIRPVTPDDKAWVKEFVTERWGADTAVGHGVIYHPHDLPGLVALQNDAKVGLITYTIAGNACEIVTIDSMRPGLGIGAALIDAVKTTAQQAGCTRLWLVTTNDNLNALRFYQKRGFVLVAVHRNAVARSRQLKPAIPVIGNDGIPIRDEIELEMQLDAVA